MDLRSWGYTVCIMDHGDSGQTYARAHYSLVSDYDVHRVQYTLHYTYLYNVRVLYLR